MVLVPAGNFQMGSPRREAGREPQEVQHRVEITRPFYIGATEVTQAQWRAVMGGNPSWFAACGPNCPVERVSWNDVQTFLTALERSTGKPFRLPTEAEWEYSCRAGSTTPFHTGDGLSTDQANYDGEGPYDGASPGLFRRSTTPAASFQPNAFGLYDMHGNVWEWTRDWHCPYPAVGGSDPLGVCPTAFKVIRGGSWYFDANSARCALRYTHRPQDSGFSIGFRVAIAAEAMRSHKVGDFGTVKDYRIAIAEVLAAGVSPRQSELLRAHLWAPGYSASSAELAEAAGYGSWRSANFQYGALAHRVAVELGVFQAPRGYWVNVFINWAADPVRSPLGHARYSLRREVARALIDLGFADAPPRHGRHS